VGCVVLRSSTDAKWDELFCREVLRLGVHAKAFEDGKSLVIQYGSAGSTGLVLFLWSYYHDDICDQCAAAYQLDKQPKCKMIKKCFEAMLEEGLPISIVQAASARPPPHPYTGLEKYMGILGFTPSGDLTRDEKSIRELFKQMVFKVHPDAVGGRDTRSMTDAVDSRNALLNRISELKMTKPL
jgi:hypothetical protein